MKNENMVGGYGGFKMVEAKFIVSAISHSFVINNVF